MRSSRQMVCHRRAIAVGLYAGVVMTPAPSRRRRRGRGGHVDARAALARRLRSQLMNQISPSSRTCVPPQGMGGQPSISQRCSPAEPTVVRAARCRRSAPGRAPEPHRGRAARAARTRSGHDRPRPRSQAARPTRRRASPRMDDVQGGVVAHERVAPRPVDTREYLVAHLEVRCSGHAMDDLVVRAVTRSTTGAPAIVPVSPGWPPPWAWNTVASRTTSSSSTRTTRACVTSRYASRQYSWSS